MPRTSVSSTGPTGTSASAGRFLRGWDVALTLVVAVTGTAVGALAYAAGQGDLTLVIARDTAGYLGLALLLHPLVGH
ncbi:hypothetical protein ACWC5I_40225, partial [Kitasatospora sp. NPDC001574]